nr:MAG TPA: hypothetical protein [Caudoviricetes sp.]
MLVTAHNTHRANVRHNGHKSRNHRKRNQSDI